MVIRGLPAIAAAIVVAIMAAARPLGPIPRAIAIACVLASFGAAAFVRRRDVRAHAAVVAGIAAVAAAGQVDGGALFGVLVAAFLVACVVALRLAQKTAPTRPRPRRTAVIFGIAGLVVAVAVFTLPPLAARIERTITGMLGVDPIQQTAFSTTMMLGATHDLLKSDAIVARIDGAPAEYLRGAVYDRYDFGRWITSPEGRARTLLAATPGGPARIELDKSAPTGSADLRWFLPPNACGFDHGIEVDGFGVARRVSGDRQLRYATGGCSPAPVRPPTAVDLELTGRSVVALTELAERWTAGASSPREKLKRIERELARYEYSLEVPRTPNVDPILDFLTIHRAGHCEFFASAMALLARTQGIQARVVGGFRTTEVNPLTGQTIVRDRHAHAWVEAWHDGGWHAWDPTPSADGPSAARSLLDHAGDLWALARERLTAIGPLGYAILLAAFALLLYVARTIGDLLRRPRRRRLAQALDRPLPCFEALSAALAAAGFVRDDAEPIEAFAARIPSAEIASALGAYAALRYGGVGREADVVRRAEQATKLTSSLPPPKRS